MRKIAILFLSFVLCFCTCFVTFAGEVTCCATAFYNKKEEPFCYRDNSAPVYPIVFENDDYIWLYMVSKSSFYFGIGQSYTSCPFLSAPLRTDSKGRTFLLSSSVLLPKNKYDSDNFIKAGFSYLGILDYAGNSPEPAYDRIADFVYSGGSDNQSYAYDSSIPAPENLKLDFIKTSGGILGLSKRTDLQLSWSNALVDNYGVQISASMTVDVFDTEGTTIQKKKKLTYKLVGLSQVDSGGADAGYPASKGKFIVTEDELLSIAQKELGDTVKVEKVNVDAFRVQFYHIESGVVSVGPVGVLSLNYSVLGKYMGSTSTVEYPSDISDIGEGGGLMPDDTGKWSGDGSGSEYDEDGNYTGSAGGSGSGNASWSDIVKELIDGLVNIPTVLSQFFGSLKSLLVGIGEFPAYLTQVVSWLPSSVVSVITLGLVLVVVLRIFGR